MRVAVASIMQESNTFAPGLCTWDDFAVAFDAESDRRSHGTNSEMAGALEAVRAAGLEPTPLLSAWAMPSAPVEHATWLRLADELLTRLAAAEWDAVVLSLHGAMATTEELDADGALIEATRDAIGDTPLVVCLDLHANVTRRMVGAATAVIGYHTDPHVDQAETGGRAARLAIATAQGRIQPVTALAKRSMIVPAETMNTSTGPLGAVRRELDNDPAPGVLDISLFPVQPWLDVPELGFGVLVTTDGDQALARAQADQMVERVYARRDEFVVERLLPPAAAVEAAAAASSRPQIVAHSADAPTAGAAGDSPAMIRALQAADTDLLAIVPLVDPPAVAIAHEAGIGASVDVSLGASIDARWDEPVRLTATVANVGRLPYRLIGASYTGMEVSMGRFAVLSSRRTHVLVSERPAWSADPATFLHAGLDPADADLLVVRSCSDYRPNYPTSDRAITLDVPGPATPNLTTLDFQHAPRPLWPLDGDQTDVAPER